MIPKTHCLSVFLSVLSSSSVQAAIDSQICTSLHSCLHISLSSSCRTEESSHMSCSNLIRWSKTIFVLLTVKISQANSHASFMHVSAPHKRAITDLLLHGKNINIFAVYFGENLFWSFLRHVICFKRLNAVQFYHFTLNQKFSNSRENIVFKNDLGNKMKSYLIYLAELPFFVVW